jgi:hypothetical protein
VVLQKFLYKDSFYSLDGFFWTSKKLIPYMIWIDIWKIWHACSSFLFAYLYHSIVCIYK